MTGDASFQGLGGPNSWRCIGFGRERFGGAHGLSVGCNLQRSVEIIGDCNGSMQLCCRQEQMRWFCLKISEEHLSPIPNCGRFSYSAIHVSTRGAFVLNLSGGGFISGPNTIDHGCHWQPTPIFSESIAKTLFTLR